ncbi:hypothetical protein L596_010871 [Steinernema carpocapsae]|uniref:Uncharacterized protein n=1 Tax=Steinernema carpocapsae TaxID=34508 RepID=A0A4U5PJM2_STECR|nr:hypothetical protein L596_010871 [Steinernema carpocapsae]
MQSPWASSHLVAWGQQAFPLGQQTALASGQQPPVHWVPPEHPWAEVRARTAAKTRRATVKNFMVLEENKSGSQDWWKEVGNGAFMGFNPVVA